MEERRTISDPEEWYPPKAWSTGHVIKTKRFNGETISYKTSYQYVEKEHTIKNAKNWIPPTQDYTLKDLIKLAYLFSARLVLKTDKQAEMDKKAEDYDLVMPTYLKMKKKWFPGMILQGFGSTEETTFDHPSFKCINCNFSSDSKKCDSSNQSNGIKWIPPIAFEDDDILLDLDSWCPPMILEGFGSYKETIFDNGYDLKVPKEFPQTNTPKIRVSGIPILGESKAITKLEDNDGNEIPLKIETGHYWVPDIASPYDFELSIIKQFILKSPASNSEKKAEYRHWKKWLEMELKVIEEDIVKAKERIMEVKLSATKFPGLKKIQAKLPALKKFQAKHGLISYKSDFSYNVAIQGDTGDVWAKQTTKVGDLLAEQKKWITGLEDQKASIQYYMKQLYLKK